MQEIIYMTALDDLIRQPLSLLMLALAVFLLYMGI